MNNNEKLKKVLKKTFTKSNIPKKIENLKLGDLEEWDSLGNFNLLLEVEKEFNYRFDTTKFSEMKSVKDIKKNLNIK
jgi:acyl carrier protein|tara:strand:- start:180 stop:410 length:231 start_codon:yes stop_codon:yes gene_type:complete